METAMETITRKDRDGWVSRTEIPLEDSRTLKLYTHRNSWGWLATHATVGKIDGPFFTYRLFQDFSEDVKVEPCARATAKVVEAQHAKVLADLDGLKARITAYYAAKDGKQEVAANG